MNPLRRPELLLITAIAGLLRLHHLGDWPLFSDENGTFWELGIFFGTTPRLGHPDEAVPDMIPISMWLHHLGLTMFGSGEFGARMMPALFGTMLVPLGYIALHHLGRFPATAAAVLLAINPEHLFYSQYHRFYSFAALFAGVALVSAARAIRYPSWVWPTLACVTALAAVWVHTLQGMLIGGVVGGWMLVRLLGDKRGWKLRLCLSSLTVAAGLSLLAFWLMPLFRAKSANYPWEGSDSFHALAGSALQAGWPNLMLAGFGWLRLWYRSRSEAAFWGLQACIWVSASALLPVVLPYHSAYVFPQSFAILILAGYGIGSVGQIFHERLVQLSWLVAILLLPLPSVISYYQDGNRPDYRRAAVWLADHTGPDDAILAVQWDHFARYEPRLKGRVVRMSPTFNPDEITVQQSGEARVWVAVVRGRSPLPWKMDDWLGLNCSRRATISKRRLDYYEFAVDLYRYEPDRRP